MSYLQTSLIQILPSNIDVLVERSNPQFSLLFERNHCLRLFKNSDQIVLWRSAFSYPGPYCGLKDMMSVRAPVRSVASFSTGSTFIPKVAFSALSTSSR